MSVTLRQVLQAFEQAGSSVRLDALSRQLGIDPGTLDGMIQHWVRKGRIKEVSDALPDGCATSCHGCDVQSGCPFVARMPRRYALATTPPPGPVPLRLYERVEPQ
ncbi:MAG TPA: FeoC-like transcriptional regulator [Aggregatilinea sp.]|jgi:hypothetical protein|uniref:FeoC-like transcriptional regulator n=1 Tax=Aggregatilinea sp. TaxID=2806333 RepID=UPI002BE1DC83|nr:FeoC-like transcriptional regulator [Aggregatilinea sp.]HML22406.1 FeoC-like transcriptional regulator [Aggregatilinea sp.]